MLALDRATNCWWESLKKAEWIICIYLDECGLKAEEARGVLPNDCKKQNL